MIFTDVAIYSMKWYSFSEKAGNRKKGKVDMTVNQDVRRAAKAAGVKLWQIAEEMGISSAWLSVRLRKELNAEQKAKIFGIIEKLAKEVC